ncbi:acyl-CoA dehydrogenase family protein [Metapseudomonas lalkuanensis]|uniref:Acyl-CoA dehydrogenase family protein n=1 Tax=Metapseudomonas lalkuanensis TaxID=2604832 RepID=A0A5J6QP42_9GAMM|nr:acyl-CoA dehydrogenase family protein [Pseudomonas lalkuanensis]QEY63091.1 acyl-CoA dehydrogenase family protein [Pseudomonas lalkuanensis]
MPIDFTLTSSQVELQQRARQFAKRTLSQVTEVIRHLPTPEDRFRATRPFYEELVREGFMQRLIPQPFGGGGTGMVDMAIVAEEFYTQDVSVPLTMFANLLGLMPLFLAGTPEQQRHFIGPFLERSGAPLAALASTEPGGSANYRSAATGGGVRTQAVLEGQEWVINGTKQWVSSASGWDGKGADLLSVVCRTDPLAAPEHGVSVILVPGPAQGFTANRAHESAGHRGHMTCNFSLLETRVPQENVIGEVGRGLDLVDASFSPTAALVGVMSLGVMRAAFDFALDFAKTERRGGEATIINHQAVGYALVDAKAAIEAVRSLSYRACFALDQQDPEAFELALHAKVFGSETAVRVITELMRVVGIESYDHLSSPLAGLLQDALAFPLFDGGNMGVRRRQLHELMRQDGYDSTATIFHP